MQSRLHRFLRGTRVLDLSRHLPGPLATLLLADMGAEVIKIEPPGGDEMRQIGPRDDQGRSLLFEAVNAGKTTRTLDLKTDTGRQTLLGLVDSADVLVESFRPGVMERLGLGAGVLRKRNPRLIYLALSGYGQEGPQRLLAGHDVNYLSTAGVLNANGSAAASSLMFPPIADCTGSMFAVSTILGALLARHADGKGCVVDIGLADVVMPFQLFSLAELGASGVVPARAAELLNGGWACYRLYATRDGRQVSLGAVEPKFWTAFCTAARRPDWLARQNDPLPQDALMGEVAAFLGGMTLQECLDRFLPADCCFAAVLDLQEAVDSDHVRARGLVRPSPHLPIHEAAYPAIIDGLRPEFRAALGQGHD
jgi:alpha-methylacyl-CoA racemase